MSGAEPTLRTPDPFASTRRRALERLGGLNAMGLGSIGDIGTRAFGTVNKLTWETATDWNNHIDEKSVVHENIGDYTADAVQLGISTDPFGDGSLVALFPQAEGSSPTVISDAVNSNDMSAEGDPQSVTGTGQATALDYDGNDDGGDGVQATIYEISSGTSFAIFTWEKSNDASQQTNFFGNGGGWGSDGYQLISTNGKFRFEITDDSGTQEPADDESGTHGDGNYHLYVGAYDSGADEMRLYRDGNNLIATTSVSFGSITPANTLQLAKQTWGSPSNAPAEATLQSSGVIKGRTVDGTDAQDLYDSASNGFLKTATKSFSTSTTPDLQNLDYDLNGETIDVNVIGSPGTASEEVVSQTLDGSTGYSLTWSSSHTDFRVEPNLTTAAITTSPVVRRIELSG